ncbi:MAG TPA: IclR family transcriptional regulator [Burkholderiaceae bacterium]|nr:IclR family transcriptional regulator [Burkholderiaceae bacterium]
MATTTSTTKLTPARKPRRGVQSIEVGCQLLHALVRNGGGMPLRDLAREAGIPAARAHPYLVSFGNVGLIRQDPMTGTYELGSFALQLGLASLHNLEPMKEALPEARALAMKIEQAVAIAVWGNMGPTLVHYVESKNPIHVNMRTGTVMSLIETATGRVFAAYLPPKLTERLAKEEIQRLTDDADAAQQMEQRFHRSLTEIRRRGLERTNGQPVPGINGFSAPVFDYDGNIALAITAVGPAGAFNTAWEGELAQAVRECAARISQRLGNLEPSAAGEATRKIRSSRSLLAG